MRALAHVGSVAECAVKWLRWIANEFALGLRAKAEYLMVLTASMLVSAVYSTFLLLLIVFFFG